MNITVTGTVDLEISVSKLEMISKISILEITVLHEETSTSIAQTNETSTTNGSNTTTNTTSFPNIIIFITVSCLIVLRKRSRRFSKQ
jgi:hypothetical protein